MSSCLKFSGNAALPIVQILVNQFNAIAKKGNSFVNKLPSIFWVELVKNTTSKNFPLFKLDRIGNEFSKTDSAETVAINNLLNKISADEIAFSKRMHFYEKNLSGENVITATEIEQVEIRVDDRSVFGDTTYVYCRDRTLLEYLKDILDQQDLVGEVHNDETEKE